MKKQKVSTLVGIIIILVATVILFGGVFAYKYFVVQKQLSQIVGWKTYTNTEYGFSFQYPDNLYAITMSYSSKNVSVCDTNNKEGSLDQNCYFGLDYYDNLYSLVGGQTDKSGNQVLTVLEYINIRDRSVSRENLSGVSGYCGTQTLPNEKIVRECIFESDGHFFNISKPDTGIGKQIFSTFKFTK